MATWGAGSSRASGAGSSSNYETGSSNDSGAWSPVNYGAGSSRDSGAGSSRDSGAGSSRGYGAGSSRDSGAGSSRGYGAGSSRDSGSGSSRGYGAGSFRDSGAESSRSHGAGSSSESRAGSSRSCGEGSSKNYGSSRDSRVGSSRSYGEGSSRDSRAGSSRSYGKGSSRDSWTESSRSSKPLVGQSTYLDLSDDDEDDDDTSTRRTDFDNTRRVKESRRIWDRLNGSVGVHAKRLPDSEPLQSHRSKKLADVRIVSETDDDLRRNTSLPFLGGDVLKEARRSQDGGPLLRGPRRVLRLCLFAVLLPLVLVLVPLYVRLMVYRPQMYAMAPSDQRLVDGKVSSVWCQGQGVRMNGSFNAYLVPHTPPTSPARPRHVILKNLKMRDDVKEYWGFYLKAGSTVTLSMCTRYDGGQLMILRGSENLHRCAWIGEEDSLEEINDFPPSENDLNNLRVATDANSDEYEDSQTNSRIGSRTFKAAAENINVETATVADDDHPIHFRTSEERQGHVSLLLGKALKMSKGKNELMDLLHAHHDALETDTGSAHEGAHNALDAEIGSAHEGAHDALGADTGSAHVGARNVPLKSASSKEGTVSGVEDTASGPLVKAAAGEANVHNVHSRARRARDLDLGGDRDGAFEVTDDDDEPEEISIKTYTRQEIGAEQIIGGLKIPDGLTYERGFVNQSHNHDLSREEHRSSYSSSEEALAECEGVILALSIRPDSQCSDFNHLRSNIISYEITVDGTYYFVFSSDNEIVINDVYFNLTLDKVVYDTRDNLANCTSSSNCSLSLGFWSDDKTVVEVPADGAFDHSFVLSTTCEPRVAVYLCFILLVPILILFCALQ